MLSNRCLFVISLLMVSSFLHACEPASEKYQIRWWKAQEKARIPQSERVPVCAVRKEDLANPLFTSGRRHIARLYPSKLLIEPNELEGYSVGELNRLFDHEAFHLLNHHPLKILLSLAASGLGLACSLPFAIRSPRRFAAWCGSAYSCKKSIQLLKYYQEYSADTEAGYGSHCYRCMEEVGHGRRRPAEDGHRQPEFYLGLAQEFKKRGLVCDDHPSFSTENDGQAGLRNIMDGQRHHSHVLKSHQQAYKLLGPIDI